jgi:hypothetical protein
MRSSGVIPCPDPCFLETPAGARGLLWRGAQRCRSAPDLVLLVMMDMLDLYRCCGGGYPRKVGHGVLVEGACFGQQGPS